jgi:hypothetical protein
MHRLTKGNRPGTNADFGLKRMTIKLIDNHWSQLKLGDCLRLRFLG